MRKPARYYLQINKVRELALQLSLLEPAFLSLDTWGSRVKKDIKTDSQTGKIRELRKPSREHKLVLSKINSRLLDRLHYPLTLQGGIKGRSLITNAQFHVGKKFVASYDIQGFFPNIGSGAVYNLFVDLKCAPDVARIITKLTTIDGQLPQGYPTSPKISALILRQIDQRLSKLLVPLGYAHTFWIDDLTISGYRVIPNITKKVSEVFRTGGFRMSKEKTEEMRRSTRQVSAGLVVNRRPNAKKSYRRKVEQEVYYCRRFGIRNHLARIGISANPEYYKTVLIGKLSFLSQFDQKYAALMEIVRVMRV